jgi:hypothetical protein
MIDIRYVYLILFYIIIVQVLDSIMISVIGLFLIIIARSYEY